MIDAPHENRIIFQAFSVSDERLDWSLELRNGNSAEMAAASVAESLGSSVKAPNSHNCHYLQRLGSNCVGQELQR